MKNKHAATTDMKHQRGVLMLVTPLLILLIIMLGALALDGARLYSLRQEMQSQVNAAATAAADGAQACGGERVTLASIRDMAFNAAKTQGYKGQKDDLLVQPGVIESDSSKVLSFVPLGDTQLARSNGVVVEYRKKIPVSALLPESIFGTVELSATAAARKELITTLSAAGSTAVLGGTSQTPNLLNVVLGEALNNGGPLSLDPTDYESLAKATVKLGDLLDDLKIGTIEELVGTQVLLEAVFSALKKNNDSLQGIGGALDQLIAASGVDETISLGDVIKVVGTTEIPKNSRLPVYDTVIALVLNLAEGQLLDREIETGIEIPGVTKTHLSLFIGRAPAVVVGPARMNAGDEWITRFYSPDIGLTLVSDLNVLGSLLKVSVPLSVRVGGGSGALVWADCVSGFASNEVRVGVDVKGSVARVGTGSIDENGDFEPKEISLTVLKDALPDIVSLASITAELDLDLGGGEEQVSLSYVLDEMDPSDAYTSGGLSKADLAKLKVRVELLEHKKECSNFISCLLDGIGDLLSGIVNGITDLLGLEKLIKSTVEGLIDSLGTILIDPLLNALGVSIGTVHVQITGADQNNVQLLEYCSPEGC